MKRLNEILTAVLLGQLIALAAAAAWWAHSIEPSVSAALWNFTAASWELKQNSGRELQETEKATAAAKNLFDHTDITLNGPKAHPGLIPHLTVLARDAQPVVEHVDVAITALTEATRHLDQTIVVTSETVGQLKGAVQQFQASIADMDKIITDPKIREILANLADATRDMDASIKQLDALLASGTATAEDVRQVADKIREQYTKARNLYYAVFKELLSVGSQGVQFFLRK